MTHGGSVGSPSHIFALSSFFSGSFVKYCLILTATWLIVLTRVDLGKQNGNLSHSTS